MFPCSTDFPVYCLTSPRECPLQQGGDQARLTTAAPRQEQCLVGVHSLSIKLDNKKENNAGMCHGHRQQQWKGRREGNHVAPERTQAILPQEHSETTEQLNKATDMKVRPETLSGSPSRLAASTAAPRVSSAHNSQRELFKSDHSCRY